VITNAIGGENVSTVIDGRERYPINVRYLSDFRSDRMRSAGRWFPLARSRYLLSQIADIRPVEGRRCSGTKTECWMATCLLTWQDEIWAAM